MKTEHVIIRGLCTNADYMRRVLPFLKDEYFADAPDLTVFRVVKDHILKYDESPGDDVLSLELENLTGIAEEVSKRSRDLVAQLAAIPINTNTAWLIDHSEQFCKDRAIYNAVNESIAILNGEMKGKDRGILPELLREALAVSFESNIGFDLLEDYEKFYEYLHENLTRIPFGVEKLNLITNGGLPPKTLTTIVGGTNVGKAQPNNTLVATPTGWRKIGELKVGEYVMGSNGLPTKVLGVYPRGVLPIYRLTTWDGSTTLSADDHLWTVKIKGEWQTRTTKELSILKNKRIQLPSNRPVEFNESDLPMDPYVLGLLVGDGCYSVNSSIGYSSADQELIEYISNFYKVTKRKNYDYYVVGANDDLRKSGLKFGNRSWEKEIPEKYLLGTSAQRLAVLQGLMDTDGYVNTEGAGSGAGTRARFNSTSRKLCENVAYLVRSLGGVAKISDRVPKFYPYKGEKRQGRPYFEVSVALSPEITPFRLKRKVEKWKPKEYRSRIIKSILPEGEDYCTCIKVEAEDSLYITEDFIVTHNTLAMCSLAGDNLAMGYDVLYITAEMSKDEIAKRIYANVLDTGLEQLPLLRLNDLKNKVDNLRRKTMGKLIVHEYPNGTASAANVRALISELSLKKSFKPQIIYVDYLSIMASSRVTRKGTAKHEYVMSISEEFRSLAQIENVPVVSAIQLNRDGFGSSDADIDDVADSFGASMTMDLMLILSSNDELQKLGQYIVKQGKNRLGPKHKHRAFVIGVDYDKQRLYDVEDSANENVGMMRDVTPPQQTQSPQQVLMARKKPAGFQGFTV